MCISFQYTLKVIKMSKKLARILGLKSTSSQRGRLRDPLERYSGVATSALMEQWPSQMIWKKTVSSPLRLVIFRLNVSWFCNSMLFVLTLVSGTKRSASRQDLISLLERRIFPNSCLLTVLSTWAIERCNLQRTGLWSLSVTSMQASYLQMHRG